MQKFIKIKISQINKKAGITHLSITTSKPYTQALVLFQQNLHKNFFPSWDISRLRKDILRKTHLKLNVWYFSCKN